MCLMLLLATVSNSNTDCDGTSIVKEVAEYLENVLLPYTSKSKQLNALESNILNSHADALTAYHTHFFACPTTQFADFNDILFEVFLKDIIQSLQFAAKLDLEIELRRYSLHSAQFVSEKAVDYLDDYTAR